MLAAVDAGTIYGRKRARTRTAIQDGKGAPDSQEESVNQVEVENPIQAGGSGDAASKCSRLQGLHQGPVTTWSVTLFALYFTTKCSLEVMLAPVTVAKRPLTEPAGRRPNTPPT